MKAKFLLFGLVLAAAGCTSSMRLVRSEPPGSTPKGEAPFFIQLSREFRIPGYHQWTNGMTLKDGISAGGGFTDFAGRTLILRHWDGSADWYRLGSRMTVTINPELKPGDEIVSISPYY